MTIFKMSWIQELKLSWLERFCISVLKAGPIPKHIALIMDGNRRYATRNGLQKLEGHSMGFSKLSETLSWCLELGITEITIYVFSIENFKRPKEEVNCLMNLAIEKFTELVKEKEKLVKHGVCVRIFGDIKLLPVELQKLVAEAVLLTYENTNLYLNVCLAYTSRQEITAAVKDLAHAVANNQLEESDLTEDLLSKTLYSGRSTNPDVVIRTSGEVRLSDFLLWQSSYSVISFLKVLWPDFRIWHLFLAVLAYQYNYKKLHEIEKNQDLKTKQVEGEKEMRAIIQQYEKIHNLSEGSSNHSNIPDSDIDALHEEIKIRKTNFLLNLENEHYNSLIEIKKGNTKQRVPDFS
ncbi:dehydrodolichyl diphosphate synthase complex subunit DHDDS isoform X1 [Parasteatoda tepidariorum]|uniref:dehydrodolichyl diphosphate synthase complex subunit DHDDS isoform X1 n=3 Tax=Parasteatoda tepidariorum TaxID=114398 RepID=UPI001C71E71D|nr:dehydrodolichyl diphosphate synthase complex subunit DHDDS isoform X2 [Parasteatoda tepidariorum]